MAIKWEEMTNGRPRPKIKFTYLDYKNAPEDKRYELLDGELVILPSPPTIYQDVSINLMSLLWTFVKERGLGEVCISPLDVVLSDTDVVQPDILFVSNERMDIITEDNIQGAPDLVIEILSPSTAERDRTFKRSLYARHGVREYWLVDPGARSVEVMELGKRDFKLVAAYGQNQTLISPLLKCLRLDLKKVSWQLPAIRQVPTGGQPVVGPRPKIKFTYQDYKNAPEDKRYELLDGDLVVAPSPRIYHQDISLNLEHLLWTFIKEGSLGRVYHAPIDVVLSDTDVVQPDILFVSNEGMDIITEDNVRGGPDLVIEILSPSTAERDRTFKRSLYARHGVREYWLVDPEAKSWRYSSWVRVTSRL